MDKQRPIPTSQKATTKLSIINNLPSTTNYQLSTINKPPTFNFQFSTFNYISMQTLKGPGIFLAQFAGDSAPYNTLPGICGWAKEKGFVGIQIPSWDARFIDLQKAADSKLVCERDRLPELGVVDIASYAPFLSLSEPEADRWLAAQRAGG